MGQSVSQALSISNTGTGPAGFVEDLNASFGTATGTGASLISGTASISGLLAGKTTTTCMTVSVNTLQRGDGQRVFTAARSSLFTGTRRLCRESRGATRARHDDRRLPRQLA